MIALDYFKRWVFGSKGRVFDERDQLNQRRW